MPRPMTVAEKILAAHAGLDEVRPGQLVECDLDLVLANDITAPIAIDVFRELGATEVFDRDRVCLVPDHYAPNKDIKSAEQTKKMRDFAHEQKIRHYWEQGCAGIEHALLPEQGVVVPGDLVIGADSHTCTYGALGAFSTGVGSTDLAAGMMTGQCWFKVPSAIRFVLRGALPAYVTGKDLILHIIGMIGVDGALYKSMEFTGEGVASLSMDDRFTVCNMAIEAGAKNGIFPVDDKTLAYMQGRFRRPVKIFEADDDAEYEKTIEIDLSALKPTVAFPHLPENTKTAWENIPIDQVVIGSCTNGRISDLRQAAEILRGRTVAKNVRCIVIPATQEIYLQAIREGLADIFIGAGAVLSTPTCGPCLGGHMGILADHERCVSTTNRNFVGRMGHITSEIYLASPYTAAASAVLGRLATAGEVTK